MLDEGKWQVDRRVNLAFVGMIVLQTTAAVWFAASINAKVTELDTRTTNQEKAFGSFLQAREESVRSNERRLTTVETLLPELRTYMQSVDSRLGRIEADSVKRGN